MTGLLEGKTAIIYGGGGGIGGGVARTFAREGAKVFLVGRTQAKLDAVAGQIKSAGGSAGVAAFVALDEAAVDEHVRGVVAETGHVDVSFNLVTRGDAQDTPLVDMAVDDLLRAVVTGLKSNFITSRAAARQMMEQGSGVILHLNSASGGGAMPGMGSTGPADAAIETYMRYLAAKVGPHGVPRLRHLDRWRRRNPDEREDRCGQRRRVPRTKRRTGDDRQHVGSKAPATPGRGRRLPGLRQGRRHHRFDGERNGRVGTQMTEWAP